MHINPRKPDPDLAGRLAELWISAALRISVIHHFLDDEAGSVQKRGLMFKLGDFQFATELAFNRLYAQAPTPSSGNARSFAPILICSADAHSLLVFASGYFRALRDLCRLMPFTELVSLIDEIRPTIDAVVTARNHIEHITERIASGRRRRRSTPEMPIEDFQQSIGRLEFPSIIFGDETFDLSVLSYVVLSAGRRIAPALESCFESGIRKYVDALLCSE